MDHLYLVWLLALGSVGMAMQHRATPEKPAAIACAEGHLVCATPSRCYGTVRVEYSLDRMAHWTTNQTFGIAGTAVEGEAIPVAGATHLRFRVTP